MTVKLLGAALGTCAIGPADDYSRAMSHEVNHTKPDCGNYGSTHEGVLIPEQRRHDDEGKTTHDGCAYVEGTAALRAFH
jgi:hypothetical protein